MWLRRVVVVGLFLLAAWATTIAGMLHYWRFAFSAGHPVPLWTASTVVAGVALFAAPLLLIILAHEYGHIWAAHQARIAWSGPYFLPFPFHAFLIGVMGACVVLHDPQTPRQRSQIALSGLYGGLLACLPLLMLGVILSHPGRRAGVFAADPLIMRMMSAGGLVLHPIALAARYGLWLTAINALPIWPMDGWRIVMAGWQTRQWLPSAAVLLIGVLCWPF